MTATTEPVVHAPAAHAEGHHTSTGLSNTKVGMWAFLGSDCLLFGGLISTFLLMRSKSVLHGLAVAKIYDTDLVARTLLKEYYGQPAHYNYFVGCSNGGKNASVAASNYMDHYDGIVGQAGVLDTARFLAGLRQLP